MKIRLKHLPQKPLLKILLTTLAFVAVAGGGVLAAFLLFVQSDTKSSDWSKPTFVDIELDVPELTGSVTPGDSKSISAVVTNTGTGRGLAFIKFEYPMYTPSGSSTAEPVYTWEANSGWTAVESGSGYTVYGYTQPLDEDESTSSLMDEITMKNLSNSEYKGLEDVNIALTGYIADCNEYGEELDVVWEAANQQ